LEGVLWLVVVVGAQLCAVPRPVAAVVGARSLLLRRVVACAVAV
jgi:hypothetical protein